LNATPLFQGGIFITFFGVVLCMATCQEHGLEFKKPWHIVGVEVVQNAPLHNIVKVAVDPRRHRHCYDNIYRQ